MPGSILTLKVHVNQTQVPALPSICGSEGSWEAQREGECVVDKEAAVVERERAPPASAVLWWGA